MFIPELENLAETGVLDWGILATLKDRTQMFDGKPQIYGTQTINDRLYKLQDPEYVDQRRAAVGLGPLADYLKRFDIDFTVIQKKK